MNLRLLISSRFAVLLFALPIFPASAACPITVWADEFSGTSPDSSKWEIQTGDGCGIGLCGWGNNELQYYKAGNLTVGNGALTITAKKERTGATAYTSGRIRSAGDGNGTLKNAWNPKNFSSGVARLEARIQLPDGRGMWPAFWMLPTDPTTGWPVDGEIDIMESRGQSPQTASGALHFGNPWPDNRSSSNYYVNESGDLGWGKAFQVHAIEWDVNEIRWFINDALFQVKKPSDLHGHPWPFGDGSIGPSHNFHILLNMAVGGTMGGTVFDTDLPDTYSIDYVRVLDGRRPQLKGDLYVALPSSGAVRSVYSLSSASAGSWTVTGGTVVSSSSSSVTVDWSVSGIGSVTANVSESCDTNQDGKVSMPVFVEPYQGAVSSYKNFDGGDVPVLSTSGTLTTESAPPSGASGKAGKYVRSTAVYDLIVFDASATGVCCDGGSFTSLGKYFYMDVYTDAPVGTKIQINWEDSAKNTGTFPAGRHSGWIAETQVKGGWHTLKFRYDGRYDAGTLDSAVNRLVLLFNPGWPEQHTYWFDNFQSRAAGSSSGTATSMHVKDIVASAVNASGGKKKGQAVVTMADNLGNPASSVTVNGHFEGSWTDVVSGVTDSTGKVTFTTSTAKSGTVTVKFCVDGASHATLSYNSAGNVKTCSP